MKKKSFILSIIVFLLALATNFDKALAGCGCEHPPPLPASVIPLATWPGTLVKLYSDMFIPGQNYTVWFGMVSATGIADMDRERRYRVRVTLPNGSIGPTPIVVRDKDGLEVLSIPSGFTVVSSPYVLPSEGKFKYLHQRLAVGADGILYVPLDMSNVKDAVDIKGWLDNYPLRIDAFAVLNVQGYDMKTEGLKRIITSKNSRGSDKIFYDRHSFEAYYENHAERDSHQLDPNDPDYHLDGTRHIDHNHLILAILGHFNDGTTPKPGVTPEVVVEVQEHLNLDKDD